MRRYLAGLQKEYDGLQERVQSLVGRTQSDGTTITAENVEQTFKHNYTQYLELATTSFEEDARSTQKDLARGRISTQVTGRGYALSEIDKFLLSRRGAYAGVVNAPGALWKLYQIEASWQREIIDQENMTRQKQLFEAFGAAAGATYAQHPAEFHDWDDANRFKAELEALAKQNDERDYRYSEDTAQRLRALAGRVKDAHRRLTHDTQDWKNFAAKDGETPAIEWPLNRPEELRPIVFAIHPSRDDPVKCCLFTHWSPDQPSIGPDPETLRWAHFPQELLQKYPEITLNGQTADWQTDSPWVAFNFAIDSQTTVVTAVASGASATERP
ncbi:MAG TPA: hypothetical protein VGX03_05900 [Candidatus Binatia bacterium]|jgi:hypothetical protein|nr:hypothetical protein [Candidatus Binatia bacterium]